MNTQKKYKTALVTNKRAHFSYTILDKYTAGIVLDGSEVKSIRMHNANLRGAHCYFHNNELWLSGMHVGAYSPASYYKRSPTRSRKLLLHKHELRRLHKRKLEKSLTIIPLQVFLSEKGLIKVEIASAQGKRKYDKRAAIKERDVQRRMRKKIHD